MHEPRLRRPQTILTGHLFQLNPRLDHSWLLHNLVPLCVGLCKRDARSDGGERSCFLTCLPRALSFGSGSLWWPTFLFSPLVSTSFLFSPVSILMLCCFFPPLGPTRAAHPGCFSISSFTSGGMSSDGVTPPSCITFFTDTYLWHLTMCPCPGFSFLR